MMAALQQWYPKSLFLLLLLLVQLPYNWFLYDLFCLHLKIAKNYLLGFRVRTAVIKMVRITFSKSYNKLCILFCFLSLLPSTNVQFLFSSIFVPLVCFVFVWFRE